MKTTTAVVEKNFGERKERLAVWPAIRPKRTAPSPREVRHAPSSCTHHSATHPVHECVATTGQASDCRGTGVLVAARRLHRPLDNGGSHHPGIIEARPGVSSEQRTRGMRPLQQQAGALATRVGARDVRHRNTNQTRHTASPSTRHLRYISAGRSPVLFERFSLLRPPVLLFSPRVFPPPPTHSSFLTHNRRCDWQWTSRSLCRVWDFFGVWDVR